MMLPASTSSSSSLSKERASRRQRKTSTKKKHEWWWCNSAASESSLLSAAVLCAALGQLQQQPDRKGSASTAAAATTTTSANANELERIVKSSPLPHTLKFPLVVFTEEFVLIECDAMLLCAIRATDAQAMLEAIVGTALPLQRPYEYRFGGARIHVPFWQKMQQIQLMRIYQLWRSHCAAKPLLFCGHSIGGSVAHLCTCELIYQSLSTKLRLALEKQDYDQEQNDQRRKQTDLVVNQATENGNNYGNNGMDAVQPTPIQDQMLLANWDEYLAESEEPLPQVFSVGFGAPFISTSELRVFLDKCNLSNAIVTFVNEFDCIPGILQVAQATAMLTKTTERFMTITKATKTLLQLLPSRMQQCFLAMPSAEAIGNFSIPSATSAYVSMSLSILQKTFKKFREQNIIKPMDFDYQPCGTYVFLARNMQEYRIEKEQETIRKALDIEDVVLTGNAVLQHFMSAYVDAIAKRSKTIQINATMNYYERLNVPRNASDREIRTAYKTLALKWHPDRWSRSANANEKEMAEQVFKLLAESYEVLSDAEARKAYDYHLRSSLTEEFVRSGTVNGMTLDEAIVTFRNVLDQCSGAISHVTSRFTSSSSSVVGQPGLRRVTQASPSLVANNHDNLFLPDHVRVSRRVEMAGLEQQEQILYVRPDEVLPGDVAAPSDANLAKVSGGMSTMGVVGGAVVVGASVALLVSAWGQYSEASRKQKQAEAVRKMPTEYLLLLLEDYQTEHPTPPREQLEQVNQEEIVDQTNGDAAAIVVAQSAAQRVALHQSSSDDQVAKDDDDLFDEFYDCIEEHDAASMEAFAEEEFFDCVDLVQAVDLHFGDEDQSSRANKEAILLVTDTSVRSVSFFPIGCAVSTPFGIGRLETWIGKVAVVGLDKTRNKAFVQRQCIERGAVRALTTKKEQLEQKRHEVASYVIEKFNLVENNQSNEKISALVSAGTDGAMDSGIRVAGGVVLGGGSAGAAPLAIASILVDIGKEYYDYRQKQKERASRGVLSAASERLLMNEFRLKAGLHIASGTTAAAGASLGAYSVASAVGFWTGVGITGPVGVLAATSAAVVGGMLGYFAGSKAYTGYTSSYFTSHQTAIEQIDRLELGARILFSEYDPTGKGTISREGCKKIMKKLYEASVDNATASDEASASAENGFAQAVASLAGDDQDEVSWASFWRFVSSEALKSLELLEAKQQRRNSNSNWFSHYLGYFSYGNRSQKVLAGKTSCMYPSVLTALGYRLHEALQTQDTAKPSVDRPVADSEESNDLVLRAQVEYLVNTDQLTSTDAIQLERMLMSPNEVVRQSAVRTIGQLFDALSEEQVVISEAFTGGDERDGPHAEPATSDQVTCRDKPKTSMTTKSPKENKGKQLNEREQLDVFCSLMSTQGLANYLYQRQVAVPENAKHEDLHYLALLNSDAESGTNSAVPHKGETSKK